MQYGTLYLIPTPLGEDPVQPIPDYVGKVVGELKHFVAERAKTARKALKDMGYPHPLREAEMIELNERTPEAELEDFLKLLLAGHSIGVLSEAGCPGVADPGARAVAWAHRNGVRVAPLVGPSSILLALMASGMNGQSFCFHGYLPQEKGALSQHLRKLEQQSAQQNQTQLFIETPYRNQALLEVAFQSLKPSTLFCIAADLTLPTEFIATKTIGEWKKRLPPELNKRPALFLIHTQGGDLLGRT
ncbi:MAG: SAM-dependent methyltransferase [Lewinellaceae bacterium]|nr:SAM-dependent methyltransferase [Lewinellaceae bacterium]